MARRSPSPVALSNTGHEFNFCLLFKILIFIRILTFETRRTEFCLHMRVFFNPHLIRTNRIILFAYAFFKIEPNFDTTLLCFLPFLTLPHTQAPPAASPTAQALAALSLGSYTPAPVAAPSPAAAAAAQGISPAPSPRPALSPSFDLLLDLIDFMPAAGAAPGVPATNEDATPQGDLLCNEEAPQPAETGMADATAAAAEVPPPSQLAAMGFEQLHTGPLAPKLQSADGPLFGTNMQH
ncbi:hypothetical protein PAPYR_8879 [Paratrimastix pyriformis]|uniref:Uncharacterized protein n=1 Tax=Paratrimastix pyriformis TaxID=342808 RepID=A0ABQ8UF75_9EUKA|nr:hypothetical protein PAPYR_8879 [Paratrimastix pyriformis]